MKKILLALSAVLLIAQSPVSIAQAREDGYRHSERERWRAIRDLRAQIDNARREQRHLLREARDARAYGDRERSRRLERQARDVGFEIERLERRLRRYGG